MPRRKTVNRKDLYAEFMGEEEGDTSAGGYLGFDDMFKNRSDEPDQSPFDTFDGVEFTGWADESEQAPTGTNSVQVQQDTTDTESTIRRQSTTSTSSRHSSKQASKKTETTFVAEVKNSKHSSSSRTSSSSPSGRHSSSLRTSSRRSSSRGSVSSFKSRSSVRQSVDKSLVDQSLAECTPPPPPLELDMDTSDIPPPPPQEATETNEKPISEIQQKPETTKTKTKTKTKQKSERKAKSENENVGIVVDEKSESNVDTVTSPESVVEVEVEVKMNADKDEIAEPAGQPAAELGETESVVEPEIKKTKKKKFAAKQADKCNKCSKPVYATERTTDAKAGVFHRKCLRCATCKVDLTGKQRIEGELPSNIAGSQYRFIPIKEGNGEGKLTCFLHSTIVRGDKVAGTRASRKAKRDSELKVVSDLVHGHNEDVKEELELVMSGASVKCERCGGYIQAAQKIVVSGMSKYHEICPSEAERALDIVEPSVVIKKSPERLAVMLDTGANAPLMTFLLVLEADAKRNAIRTRKVLHWHLHLKPDAAAHTGNSKRLPDAHDISAFGFNVKEIGTLSAVDPVGVKAQTPTAGLVFGTNVFGTVGKSKVLKLKAELRFGGNLLISGVGGGQKLKGGNLNLQLAEYQITLNETDDMDATHLDFRPITDQSAKSKEQRFVGVTFVGKLFEMRCWKRRISWLISSQGSEFFENSRDMLTVTRFQLARGVLQTLDFMVRVNEEKQLVEVLGLVVCVEAYPPVSTFVPSVVVDGKTISTPSKDPLASLKNQLRSRGPSMADFADKSNSNDDVKMVKGGKTEGMKEGKHGEIKRSIVPIKPPISPKGEKKNKNKKMDGTKKVSDISKKQSKCVIL